MGNRPVLEDINIFDQIDCREGATLHQAPNTISHKAVILYQSVFYNIFLTRN